MAPAAWKWTETSPWPPIEAVKASVFWKAAAYEGIRQRLKRPVPNVAIDVSGGYVTLSTNNLKASLDMDPDMDEVFSMQPWQLCKCAQLANFLLNVFYAT